VLPRLQCVAFAAIFLTGDAFLIRPRCDRATSSSLLHSLAEATDELLTPDDTEVLGVCTSSSRRDDTVSAALTGRGCATKARFEAFANAGFARLIKPSLPA